MLWWGTFLGAVREQAMIAWDYDVDLVCFIRPHVCMTEVWHGMTSSLRAFGYTLSRHGKKFRISPNNPLTWAPWQELCQEVRERNPKLSRREIFQTAASHWQQGKQAKQPHGKNCIDIEFYYITDRSPIEVAGSQKITVKFNQVFPSAISPFGPLYMRIPRTTAVLEAEYGSTCLTTPACKQLAGSGGTGTWFEVPVGVRRSVWPTCPLKRCAELTDGSNAAMGIATSSS